MADESKKTVNSATETESKNEAAAKVAKAAKSSPAKVKKAGPSLSERIKKYFKDVKGETKKIVWPDAKTVFKSTGVVLLVVIICGLIIYGIDQGLSAGVQGLKGLANETSVSEDADKEDSKADETEEKKESDSEDKNSDEKEATEEAKEDSAEK